MSSFTAAQSSNTNHIVKRRRACDVCRRSKIRCNVSTSDNAPCAHCSRFKLECTFIDESKRRTPPKSYITSLENRCKKLEVLVQRIAPDIDIDAEVGPSFTQETWSDVVPTIQVASATPAEVTVAGPRTVSASLNARPATNSDEDVEDQLQKHLAELRLDTDISSRFQGKSSANELIRMAKNLKDGAIGNTLSATIESASPLRKKTATPSSDFSIITWPPDDLLNVLVDIYFDQTLLPIIYRPTFDRNLKEGLHKTDSSFAKLVLALCALSSQCCEDPRVCLQAADGTTDWSTAGWKYFSQLLKMNQTIFGRTSLSSLQTIAIASLYLQYLAVPHLSWLLSGIGVRFALDIGLHREKVYAGDQPLENQLWKRAFWTLIGIDIMMSSRLGRPTAASLEEIDAELPLEVGDEHYDDATGRWNQPAGEPCRLSSLVQFIKLEMIVARTLQTVYAVRNPTASAVADLDNALNKWLDELPSYLRWDPVARDLIYQEHSALLRIVFLHTRITLHRRFLPMMLQEDAGPTSALSASALAICTTAAQAIIRVLETVELMGGKESPMTGYAFGAAIILLLNMWNAQRKGPPNVDVSSHLGDVQRCIRILRGSERRWKGVGRLVDILTELSSMSDVYLTQRASAGRQKRNRDDADDYAQSGPRSFQPEFGMSSASSSSIPFQTLDGLPLMPSSSLAPGVFDISAIQWDPTRPAGFMPPIGSHPVASFGIPGLVGGQMGSSESDAAFPGAALPSDAFWHLFGNMDDMHSAAGQLPPVEPTGNDLYGANVDWAAELTFLGMNTVGGDNVPPSNP